MKQLIRPVAIAAAFFYVSTTSAQQLSPADQEYFEAKIRPILIDYCYDCHGDGRLREVWTLALKPARWPGALLAQLLPQEIPAKVS